MEKRFFVSSFFAWLIFLAIDFFAHASVMAGLWDQNLHALKSKDELFRMIPFGYVSFLLLTLLFGILYKKIHADSGNVRKGLEFGGIFGLLFSISIFLGWYSFLSLPALFLLAVSAVYFIEILALGFTFGWLLHRKKIAKRLWMLGIMILALLMAGVILQNVHGASSSLVP